jgi:nucleotide-binding universal stress UspA family protein
LIRVNPPQRDTPDNATRYLQRGGGFMFKHILVPVDGSETSFLAADKALEIARDASASVTLVHAIDSYPYAGMGHAYGDAQANYLSAANAAASRIFATITEKANIHNIPIEVRIVETSNSARGIVEAAESVHADVIVMGTHGRSTLNRVVVGSVTQRVLAQTKIPVLVIRSDE